MQVLRPFETPSFNQPNFGNTNTMNNTSSFNFNPQNYFPYTSSFSPQNFPNVQNATIVEPQEQEGIKRKRSDEMDMEEYVQLPQRMKRRNIRLNRRESLKNDHPIVEEPEDDKVSSTKMNTENHTPIDSSNGQLILYQKPNFKIPKGIDASTLWNRLVLDDNGVIHLLNKFSGEEARINQVDLSNGQLIKRFAGSPASVRLNHADSDDDSEEDQPRIVEITDEEEQEIIRQKNQREFDSLETEMEDMDIA